MDADGRFAARVAYPEVNGPSSLRKKIAACARGVIGRGGETPAEHLAARPEVFSVGPPQASAMSFVRFDPPIGCGNVSARSDRFCSATVDREALAR